MKLKNRIGIDLMGGENAPHTYFGALEEVVRVSHREVKFSVFATQEVIDQLSHLSEHLDFYPVTEEISMDEDPLTAVRRKRQSSIVCGVQSVKSGEIAAFVSSGNTGALIAACVLFLPPLAKVERPALLALLPTKRGSLAVIDVGGLVDFKAKHLVSCAWMGAAYQRVTSGIALPAIGLLNIGTESRKGTSEVRRAHRILEESAQGHRCQFVGNIEGRHVFEYPIDVLVTDGFTGNVFLKTAEGISADIYGMIQMRLQQEGLDQVCQKIEAWKEQFHHATYPGAIVCGVEGLVIKCHGSSTSQEMGRCLKQACSFVRQDLIAKVNRELQTS